MLGVNGLFWAKYNIHTPKKAKKSARHLRVPGTSHCRIFNCIAINYQYNDKQ